MKYEDYRKFKFDLQMFADDEGGEGDGSSGGESQKAEVQMSQKDFDAKLNKMFAKGSKKAVDEFKNSDEYKELLALKEKNSTDTEKINERLKQADESMAELEKLRSENADFRNKAKIKGLKDPDQLDYVLFEVNKLVDDKTDFDDALKIFQESKPQHFESDDGGDGGDGGDNQNFRTSGQKKNGSGKKTKAEEYLERRRGSSRYKNRK